MWRHPRVQGPRWVQRSPVRRPCNCHHPELHCAEHVHCDLHCKALLDPGDDVEQLQKALDHWRGHSLKSGCSHGR